MGCPPIPKYCEVCGSGMKPYPEKDTVTVTYDKCSGDKITVHTPPDIRRALYCPKCLKTGKSQQLYPDHLYTCSKCGSHTIRKDFRGYESFMHLSETTKKSFFGQHTVTEDHLYVDCSICGSWYMHLIRDY